MGRMRRMMVAVVVAAGVATAAVGAGVALRAQTPPEPEPPLPAAGVPASHGGPVRDYISLVDGLRAAGALVVPEGEVSQPFFAVVGYALRVTDATVQVFEYEDEAAAQAEAGRVSPDGSSIGTTAVLWVAPPHFFASGRVLVLYLGDDPGVLDLLQSVLGPQFAGQ